MEERIPYFGELYYLLDQEDFALEKALRLTIQTVAQFCAHYRFFLDDDVSFDLKHGFVMDPDSVEFGKLPVDAIEREKLLDDLLAAVEFTKLRSNYLSRSISRFWVFQMDMQSLMEMRPLNEISDPSILEFHGDLSTFLYMPASQFSQLQAVWRDNQLPQDLFFKDHIEVPSKSFFGRMLGKTEQITPKRFEALQNN